MFYEAKHQVHMVLCSYLRHQMHCLAKFNKIKLPGMVIRDT